MNLPRQMHGTLAGIAIMVAAGGIPAVGRAQGAPTCDEFLTAARRGDMPAINAFASYAAHVYMRLDARRVANGRKPVGLPPYGWGPSLGFWARLCDGNPAQPFYNVVVSSYRLAIASGG